MSYNIELDVYEGYIYLVTNLKNNFKYVGQTYRTVEIRWAEHIKENKTLFDKEISKEGIENFKVEIIEKHSDSDLYNLKSTLNLREKYLIKKYDSLVPKYGGHGYNVDKGGWSMNFSGIPVDVYNMEGELVASYESRAEVAEKYGTKAEYVGQICNGQIPNYRCICVFRNKGESFEKYNVKSKYYKEIYQFTLDGYCIGKYYSSNQVNKKYGITFLHEVIDQPYRIAGGYWWGSTNEFRYIGEEKKGTLRITVYDLFGNILNKFDSLEKCRIFYKCSQESILNNCDGITSVLKGMIFRYDGDPYDKYIDQHRDEILNEIMISEYPIYQYNMFCELVYVHDSIRDAVSYIRQYEPENMTINTTTILNCCLKTRMVSGGYYWSYSKDIELYKHKLNTINQNINDNKHCGILNKPVDVYSLEYEYIATFYTRIDIKRFLGITKIGDISKCLSDNNNISSAYGYIWCYHGEKLDKSKHHVLKVDQYTMDDVFIKTYKNATEAEKANPGVYSSSIGKCCKGEFVQAGNYVWRYNGHPFDEYPLISFGGYKPLSCYTKDGVFVRYFLSVKEAAEFINKKTPTISAQLSGKSKTAGGYRFYYANDPNQPDPTKVTNITAKELFDQQVAQTEISDSAERTRNIVDDK